MQNVPDDVRALTLHEVRPVFGCPGYFVSRVGEVFSVKQRTVRLLKLRVQWDGHLRANITVGGRKKGAYVHRLVLESFCGPLSPGLVTRHKDGNPANNDLGNLESGTVSENCLDRRRHGTTPNGERHHLSKLNTVKVVEIRRGFAAGVSDSELGRRFGVHAKTIHDIRIGKTWHHVADERGAA